MFLAADGPQLHAVDVGVSFQDPQEVAGLDCRVLAAVAEEEDSGGLGLGQPKELGTLAIGGESAFVDNEDGVLKPVLFPKGRVLQECAQSGRRKAILAQRIGRGARRRASEYRNTRGFDLPPDFG